jgi:hypothetical protein
MPHTAVCDVIAASWPPDHSRRVRVSWDEAGRVTRVAAVVAASVVAPGPDAAAQWIAGAFAGNVWTSDTTVGVRVPAEGTDASLRDVAFADASSNSPIYYGWRLRRALPRPAWLAVEAQFVHLKAISNPAQVVSASGRLGAEPLPDRVPVGTVLPHFELSHGLNLLVIDAVVTTPLGRRGGAARAYVAWRAGTGPTLPHVEASLHGRSIDAYQWGAPVWNAAAGVGLRVKGPVWAVVDAAVTRTQQRVHAGDAEIAGRFTSRHLTAGLEWHLGQH